jgi:4-hydroxy-tetrahydrodipicolinate synthase
MVSTKQLHGIIPAVITPMTQKGHIDFTLLEKQIAYLSSAGVHGMFVNGTTGEGAYLTTPEKVEIFRLAKHVTAGRQFLCAACLQPSTQAVLAEIQAFEPLEPDFIVAVTPYYYEVTQEVIIRHYRELARHSPAPVIVYNIPSRTHNPIALETLFELTHVENIVGTKDSSGDFVTFSRGVYSESYLQFAWIQGEDYLDGPAFLIGADGIVTGLGNVWIDPYLAMYEAFKANNPAGIHQAQKQINGLYEIIQTTGGKIVPSIKTGAMLLGRSTQWMRISGLSLQEYEILQVKEVLVQLGLL